MKNLRLCALATLLLLGLTEAQAQNKKPYLLLALIQNDSHQIRPEIWSGPFFATYKDRQRDYRWHSTNIGIKTNVNLGIFLVYSEIFNENYTGEHTAFAVPVFEKSKEFRIEFGGGIKVPVEIGETGIIFEGELTSPFGEFRPALEMKIGWENKRFGFFLGDKIVVEYASLVNMTGTVFCKLY
ncbi:MAG: hypothetical protein M3Q34_01240 [bacterium]|nr:hypothetical protein [bacterium]